ncbi:hypothetical protein [Parvibaculum sedimenti]|uniref:hypothetical protein n=1 Tax=Parvibaculum sedimenti TaxID=2608632 RepID=UPI001FEC3ACE|nr:hypothetical protein [Parvibaculum sedimenti]
MEDEMTEFLLKLQQRNLQVAKSATSTLADIRAENRKVADLALKAGQTFAACQELLAQMRKVAEANQRPRNRTLLDRLLGR